MLTCPEFYSLLAAEDLTYFCGVPDSAFKAWMSFLDDRHGQGLTNRIVAIERDAIGYAAGYWAATGKIGTVYMQNAGLGNTVNALTSLADEQVYHIPMLLTIGWRGEPGRKDEPQHIKMGQVTLPLLEVLGVRYTVLQPTPDEAAQCVAEASAYMKTTGRVFALIIREGTFQDYHSTRTTPYDYSLTREEAITCIVERLGPDTVIISTTGKTSRELFEYRAARKLGHHSDFLMVGAMGLASAFGAEIALQRPDKRVVILDGDGALLMSAGNLATIGYYAPRNLYHVVFDNGCHESTGGQPTTAPVVALEDLARACGYRSAVTVETQQALEPALADLTSQDGPSILIVKVKPGSRKDLGRPTTTPIENRDTFVTWLRGSR